MRALDKLRHFYLKLVERDKTRKIVYTYTYTDIYICMYVYIYIHKIIDGGIIGEIVYGRGGKHCFSLKMYAFSSSSALYSASPSFTMFIFLLNSFNT